MIDVKLLQNTEVVYKEIPQFNGNGEYNGIKAITYDGVDIGNKKTKVFAYLGFPQKSFGGNTCCCTCTWRWRRSVYKLGENVE